jgi:hypothetical protein
MAKTFCGRTHGFDALREATEKTLAILRRSLPPLVAAAPLRLHPRSRCDRLQPTLADYDQLLQKWAETGLINEHWRQSHVPWMGASSFIACVPNGVKPKVINVAQMTAQEPYRGHVGGLVALGLFGS